MGQNQDQNDNLFNFDSQQPSQPSSEEPENVSGGAQAYVTPPSFQPEEPPPAFTPPPPAYIPPPPAYTPPPGPPPQAAPSKMNRTWLIVIIILVLLCCCCLATAVSGYFWWGDALMRSLGIY